MGVDDLGNKYYTSFDKKRRWVIYEKENYASELSIEWHGWLHWTTNSIPIKMSKSKSIMNKVFVPMDQNSSKNDHKKLGISNNSPIVIGGIYLATILLIFLPSNYFFIKIITILILFL